MEEKTMVYNESYVAADTSAVAIDLIVGVGAAAFSLVTLIGLAILYRWIKKSM